MFHHTILCVTPTSIWEILNFFVLLGTGIVVCIYTRAAQMANEINEAPLLNLTLPNADNVQNAYLEIENIGHGPAYNVKIEKISLGDYTYRFYLDSPLLAPKAFQALNMTVRTSENTIEAPSMSRFLDRLDQQTGSREDGVESTNNPAILLIHCQGVSGKKYHFVFAVYSTIVFSLELVVQFVLRGNGTMTPAQARKAWEDSEKIHSSLH